MGVCTYIDLRVLRLCTCGVCGAENMWMQGLVGLQVRVDFSVTLHVF